MINFAQAKKFFIYSLIGSLIVAAMVAVVTVLFGHFNDITTRVFATLLMAVIHSLVSLAFVWDDSRKNIYNRLSFFINTIFILIVASFVTSLFSIWKIFTAETIWHFYQAYFLIAFASLHGDILSKASGKDKNIDGVIYGNYLFISIVVLMFLPVIFVTDPINALGEMYFRILAAAGIIDGTLGILTVIFYKLYVHKHPEAQVPAEESGLSIWICILILFIFFQVAVPIFYLIGNFLWR